MGRFPSVVEQLDNTPRRLADELMAGLRLWVIAGHLPISYDAAMRMRRRLRKELARRLSGSAE